MHIKSQPNKQKKLNSFFCFHYNCCKLRMLTLTKQSPIWEYLFCLTSTESFSHRYDDGSAELQLVFNPGLQHVSAIDGKTALSKNLRCFQNKVLYIYANDNKVKTFFPLLLISFIVLMCLRLRWEAFPSSSTTWHWKPVSTQPGGWILLTDPEAKQFTWSIMEE